MNHSLKKHSKESEYLLYLILMFFTFDSFAGEQGQEIYSRLSDHDSLRIDQIRGIPHICSVFTWNCLGYSCLNCFPGEARETLDNAKARMPLVAQHIIDMLAQEGILLLQEIDDLNDKKGRTHRYGYPTVTNLEHTFTESKAYKDFNIISKITQSEKFYLAIVYPANHFNLKKEGLNLPPLDSLKNGRQADQSERYLAVELTESAREEETILVVNVHFRYQSPSISIADAICDLIAEQEKQMTYKAIIVGGDFNQSLNGNTGATAKLQSKRCEVFLNKRGTLAANSTSLEDRQTTDAVVIWKRAE